MKRHQQQPQAKPPQPPLSARSSQTLRRKPDVNSRLGISVWIRPLAMLGGAWIVVVVVALTAVNGLLSPDSSNGNRTTGATIARKTTETAQLVKGQSRLPLWLFGAIALSCAAGSILVSKQAARPPRSSARLQKSTKPKHLKPAPVMGMPEPVMRMPEPVPQSSFQHTPPAPATVPSFALAPRSAQTVGVANPFVAPVTLMQLAQTQLTQAEGAAPGMRQPTAVSVTVVPPGEKAPLDWGEASLADKLDLRKQRSVSSWL